MFSSALIVVFRREAGHDCSSSIDVEGIPAALYLEYLGTYPTYVLGSGGTGSVSNFSHCKDHTHQIKHWIVNQWQSYMLCRSQPEMHNKDMGWN